MTNKIHETEGQVKSHLVGTFLNHENVMVSLLYKLAASLGLLNRDPLYLRIEDPTNIINAK